MDLLTKRQCSLFNFTKEHQSLLKKAKVAIVGCGGLGCSAAMYLSGAGIEHLELIDGDVVDYTNLHRQIAYTVDDVNKNKAKCLGERCIKTNKNSKYNYFDSMLCESNINQLLNNVDIVLDCCDNVPARLLLNRWCKDNKKDLIYGSAVSYDGQLIVFNYSKGCNSCIYCAFPHIDKMKDTCDGLGVLGPVPGIIGSLQAIECIKLITGIGEPLKGILHYSSLDTLFNYYDVEENCEWCDKIKQNLSLEITYDEYLNNIDKYILYDIRKEEDFDEDDTIIYGSKRYSQNMVIKDNSVFICKAGIESLNLVKELREKGIMCWSIKNGFRGI